MSKSNTKAIEQTQSYKDLMLIAKTCERLKCAHPIYGNFIKSTEEYVQAWLKQDNVSQKLHRGLIYLGSSLDVTGLKSSGRQWWINYDVRIFGDIADCVDLPVCFVDGTVTERVIAVDPINNRILTEDGELHQLGKQWPIKGGPGCIIEEPMFPVDQK